MITSRTDPSPSAAPHSGWLTAEQATAYLGLPSRRALYMAIRRGQVPVHRLGRRMRFDARELDGALRGHTSR